MFSTGNLQCGATFSASNFSNATIASTFNSQAFVPIAVTSRNLKIGDVNVSLKINHTYVQDLTISLIGPPEIGSPEVFLIREACGEFDDIDAVFDDSANSIQCNSTSPSIRGTIIAAEQLSNFNGLAANGIWRVRVQDPHDFDGGEIVSASLQFCSVIPSTLSNVDFETNEFTSFRTQTSGIINIKLQKNSETESVVNVIDVQGRQIMRSTVDSEETTIDLSNFQKGIYFVKVTNGNKQTTKKIILQ